MHRSKCGDAKLEKFLLMYMMVIDGQSMTFDNSWEDNVFLRGRATGDHRQDKTAKLEQLGIVRPAYAQCNSHIN